MPRRARSLVCLVLVFALSARAEELRGTGTLAFRSYFLQRTYSVSAANKSWAAGGFLELNTDWWHDLRGDVAVFTAQKIAGRWDQDGANLLRTGQHENTVLGLACLQVRKSRTTLSLYRQRLYDPFLEAGENEENKMVPYLMEAVSIRSEEIPHLSLTASYINGVLDEYMPTYEAPSVVAGYPGVRRPVQLAGAAWTPNDRLALQLWDYDMPDFMNLVFAQGDATVWHRDSFSVTGTLQWIRQRSRGDALAGYMRTGVSSAQVSLDWDAGLSLIAAVSRTQRQNDLWTEWGGYPGFTSMRRWDNDRAGERALVVGGSYDFAAAGIPGLTLSLYSSWSSMPTDVEVPQPGTREQNLKIEYAGHGALENWTFTFKGAQVQQNADLGGEDCDDVRLIVHYRLPFSWPKRGLASLSSSVME